MFEVVQDQQQAPVADVVARGRRVGASSSRTGTASARAIAEARSAGWATEASETNRAPSAELRRESMGRLDRQPRLADAARADQRDQTSPLGAHQRGDRVQITVAAEQHRRSAPAAPPHPAATPARRSDRIQPRVLCEHRLLQRAKLPAGLHADLVDQRPPGVAGTRPAHRTAGRSDTAPASAARRAARGSDWPPRALATRPPARCGGRRRGRPARAARRRRGVAPDEAHDMRQHEAFQREVGQRRATPQCQRLRA